MKESRMKNYPVPDDVLDELRDLKVETGRTYYWMIAQALRFALRNKKKWL